ncbi:hypothetical protein DM02DRAFT_655930 [Periconia macrospinosa]|uniref:Rhodopsin domain-containing protein n=1 Tax=Periconia macrospinosa TaxID=97972 RepID=A0A2V1DPQ6_9PLEO|nr:hypothetical protein DM02DRAFT_655930 [Periconia macrospinosa]
MTELNSASNLLFNTFVYIRFNKLGHGSLRLGNSHCAFVPLELSLKEKLKVMIAFSFGLLACFASFVRLGMSHIFNSSPEASYNTAAIGKWSAMEIDISIICSCLILFPAILRHHLPTTWR